MAPGKAGGDDEKAAGEVASGKGENSTIEKSDITEKTISGEPEKKETL